MRCEPRHRRNRRKDLLPLRRASPGRAGRPVAGRCLRGHARCAVVGFRYAAAGPVVGPVARRDRSHARVRAAAVPAADSSRIAGLRGLRLPLAGHQMSVEYIWCTQGHASCRFRSPVRAPRPRGDRRARGREPIPARSRRERAPGARLRVRYCARRLRNAGTAGSNIYCLRCCIRPVSDRLDRLQFHHAVSTCGRYGDI